jgi:5-methylcytosine-specific restriction endonuclease McrA
MQNFVISLVLLSAALGVAASDSSRSRAVRAEFVRLHPCPATLKPGPCPGWQVDHVTPLCLGGLDATENLAWMTVEDHKRKTADDVAACRTARKGPAPSP